MLAHNYNMTILVFNGCQEVKIPEMDLSEEENSFAVSLQKLALKKSSNNGVFSYIKKIFDVALKDDASKKSSS